MDHLEVARHAMERLDGSRALDTSDMSIRSENRIERRTLGLSPRAWSLIRYLVGIVVLAVAIWVLSSHTGELSGASAILTHLRWWWIPPAVVVELASYVCFARMQAGILGGGGLSPLQFH